MRTSRSTLSLVRILQCKRRIIKTTDLHYPCLALLCIANSDTLVIQQACLTNEFAQRRGEIGKRENWTTFMRIANMTEDELRKLKFLSDNTDPAARGVMSTVLVDGNRVIEDRIEDGDSDSDNGSLGKAS